MRLQRVYFFCLDTAFNDSGKWSVVGERRKWRDRYCVGFCLERKGSYQQSKGRDVIPVSSVREAGMLPVGGRKHSFWYYSKTPLIRFNWDGEPSGYAENPDYWNFL